MDSQVCSLEVGGISMISDLPDASEILEVSQSTGLSPSLDHNLSFHEDNHCLNNSRMGIENTWTEASTSASDYAIPLQPPFSDLGTDPLHDPRNGIEHGPFLPSTANDNLNSLFSDTGDTPDDSIIVPAPAGVCGLRNLGNTCFMAAGLQCLTATPPVRCHFLELQRQGDKLPPPGSLMEGFSVLLNKMWSGKYNVLHPTDFKQTLGIYHSQFKDYRQHDCQEFLALLLDSLHEQMNTAKTNKSCNIPTATATTANAMNSNQNGDSCLAATFTATSNSNLIDTYDNPPSPEGSNSPNVTMAGSPRDSSIGELDSIANSPHSSPLNDDEETQDSDEIVDSKSTFIHNDMQELLKRDTSLNKFNDIAKDAKTSNANFLMATQECNNELHYDSQKFPKENSRRIVLETTNLTENNDFNNKTGSIKRIKEVNCQRSNCSPECGISSGSENECDTGLEKCNVKRMRLEDQEKNHRRDGLGVSDSLQCSRLIQNLENGTIASLDEADKHWAKHLRSNRSVIVDTFQGQFKSTVVCAVCKHVSVTYEPFMYLSVPLPHAMERQLTVTYIPSNGERPVKCVVSLNKQSRISKLKEEVLKTLDKENVAISSIAIAEVFKNHISKILEDNQLLSDLNEGNRYIYAFELTDPPEPWVDNDCGSSDHLTDPSQSGPSGSISTNLNSEELNCTVCLDEINIDLMKHDENCPLVMCDSCIKTYFKSDKENNCPNCSAKVTPSSFIKIKGSQPALRILPVSLVMRQDVNEPFNNLRDMKLFGYPRLFKLPSVVDAKHVWEMVRKVVPQEVNFTLLYVDGQGLSCSRCSFKDHCMGCEFPESGKVNLQTGATLAVRYIENVPQIKLPIDHLSVRKPKPPHPLSLYDCLQAFSQSEVLDEHNPWHCPKCERNQCATKTLTVHRYPKFLIVYLKRFVFYECVSMKLDDKVTFPLVGLKPSRDLHNLYYDLYACVCHFGGVSAGHYTAYAKNPQTDVWHYYNDDATSKQKPQEDDFSNAYILFYSQQNASGKQCNI